MTVYFSLFTSSAVDLFEQRGSRTSDAVIAASTNPFHMRHSPPARISLINQYEERREGKSLRNKNVCRARKTGLKLSHPGFLYSPRASYEI